MVVGCILRSLLGGPCKLPQRTDTKMAIFENSVRPKQSDLVRNWRVQTLYLAYFKISKKSVRICIRPLRSVQGC